MATYLNFNVERKKSSINGDGLFAVKKIPKGELIIDFAKAPGKLVSENKANALIANGLPYELQIDDDLFLVATSKKEIEDADFLNHSCDPNCGFTGKFKVVALRDIEPNEELTYDYAMTDSSDYSMTCRCGSPLCRKIITGKDWQKKNIQEKYKGFFAEYLQRKIDMAG